MSPEGRFWAKVDKTGECWVWQAGVTGGGYGAFYPRSGFQVGAHRYSWELANGEIPEGMDLDHLCRNRVCVNPAHLEPVTRSVNLKRGYEARGPKQFCIHGHALTTENTYVKKTGWRECWTCKRARAHAKTSAGATGGRTQPNK